MEVNVQNLRAALKGMHARCQLLPDIERLRNLTVPERCQNFIRVLDEFNEGILADLRNNLDLLMPIIEDAMLHIPNSCSRHQRH
jgi:hypothetical protein